MAVALCRGHVQFDCVSVVWSIRRRPASFHHFGCTHSAQSPASYCWSLRLFASVRVKLGRATFSAVGTKGLATGIGRESVMVVDQHSTLSATMALHPYLAAMEHLHVLDTTSTTPQVFRCACTRCKNGSCHCQDTGWRVPGISRLRSAVSMRSGILNCLAAHACNCRPAQHTRSSCALTRCKTKRR